MRPCRPTTRAASFLPPPVPPDAPFSRRPASMPTCWSAASTSRSSKRRRGTLSLALARMKARRRRRPRPGRTGRRWCSAATRCWRSTARSSASRPTRPRPSQRWQPMRGRSGVLHTGHCLDRRWYGGRQAEAVGVDRRALRGRHRRGDRRRTWRPVSRCRWPARSPSTGWAARSWTASRATRATWSGCRCRCCAACSANWDRRRHERSGRDSD